MESLRIKAWIWMGDPDPLPVEGGEGLELDGRPLGRETPPPPSTGSPHRGGGGVQGQDSDGRRVPLPLRRGVGRAVQSGAPLLPPPAALTGRGFPAERRPRRRRRKAPQCRSRRPSLRTGRAGPGTTSRESCHEKGAEPNPDQKRRLVDMLKRMRCACALRTSGRAGQEAERRMRNTHFGLEEGEVRRRTLNFRRTSVHAHSKIQTDGSQRLLYACALQNGRGKRMK